MELSGNEEEPEVTPEVTPEETPLTPEETPEETPATPTPESTEKEEETLYETPDGRKVNARQLQTEWKDNFLPEFTRKSQALAEIEREKELNKPPIDEPEWKKDDYVPQNYAEVIELAKREAINEMQNTAKAEQDRVTSIQTAVEDELATLKTKDASLDENALFQHANKYGFQNLTTAYANMTDMKKSAIDIEKRTVKNIKTRESDPISTVPGGNISEDSGYDPSEMSNFDGAAEFLAHVKGKK